MAIVVDRGCWNLKKPIAKRREDRPALKNAKRLRRRRMTASRRTNRRRRSTCAASSVNENGGCRGEGLIPRRNGKEAHIGIQRQKRLIYAANHRGPEATAGDFLQLRKINPAARSRRARPQAGLARRGNGAVVSATGEHVEGPWRYCTRAAGEKALCSHVT